MSSATKPFARSLAGQGPLPPGWGGGIKVQSQRGVFASRWWAKRWIAVLESFHIGARPNRGRGYACQGQVLDILRSKAWNRSARRWQPVRWRRWVRISRKTLYIRWSDQEASPMCLAIPAQVIAITDPETAVVELGGIRKSISTALLDQVAVGDYVIIHVGYALERLNVVEAEETLRLFAELAAGEVEASFPTD